MALSPVNPRGFLQQSKKNLFNQNRQNFTQRTGGFLGSQEVSQGATQQLQAEQADKQNQARTALAFRNEQEQKRQFDAAQTQRNTEIDQSRQFARRERKREKKIDPISVVATITKRFTNP